MNEPVSPGKVVTLTIDGLQYRVTQTGGLTGARIIFRGGQAFSAALSEGFSAKRLDPAIATSMAIARRMSVADFDWICDEMAKVTTVGIPDPLNPGRPPTFVSLAERYDDHFRGRYMAQMDWLKGALETNFGDFFVELQARFDAWAAAAAASSSKGPKAPTDSGSSGVSSSPSG
jgi:hypothetical protein